MMEEPPPPSYDEAVTMDLASPPLPLKSPPLPPQTHLPPSPSCPPLPSSESFSEIPHLNVETRPPVTGQRHARTVNNISNLPGGDPDRNGPSSSSSSRKSCAWLMFGFIVVAVVIGLVAAILPKDKSDTLDLDESKVPSSYEVYEPIINCKSKPPNLMSPEATWSNCSTNAKGEYEHGTKCEFQCKDDLFMYVLNSDKYFKNDKPTGALQSTSANYTCLRTKWVSLMEDHNIQKFQCLPKLKSSDFCHLKDLKKEVPGSRKRTSCFYSCSGKKCYFHSGDFYIPGSTCALECPDGYAHYIQNSTNKMRKISQGVPFTCQKSKWVSSLNGKYKNSQCLKITRKPDCPYIHTPGLAMKNCLQNPKGDYFSGTKCNLECEKNFRYLYMHSNNDINEVQEDLFVEPIHPSDVSSEVFSGASSEVSCETLEESRPTSKWTLTLANGTKLQDKIFQCLGTTYWIKDSWVHHDCREKPYVNVNQEYWNSYHGRSYGSRHGSLHCPKNNPWRYTEGSVCTWQCDEGYQLSNNRYKKTAKWTQKMTRFFYTCWNARWKHSLQDSDLKWPSKFHSEWLYCVK